MHVSQHECKRKCEQLKFYPGTWARKTPLFNSMPEQKRQIAAKVQPLVWGQEVSVSDRKQCKLRGWSESDLHGLCETVWVDREKERIVFQHSVTFNRGWIRFKESIREPISWGGKKISSLKNYVEHVIHSLGQVVSQIYHYHNFSVSCKWIWDLAGTTHSRRRVINSWVQGRNECQTVWWTEVTILIIIH